MYIFMPGTLEWDISLLQLKLGEMTSIVTIINVFLLQDLVLLWQHHWREAADLQRNQILQRGLSRRLRFKVVSKFEHLMTFYF